MKKTGKIVAIAFFLFIKITTTLGQNFTPGVRLTSGLSYGILKDTRDNIIYKTIKIGNQVWMAENLRTTKYRNGDSIPTITSNSGWKNLTTGACCSYNNEVSDVYGKLYNWFAVADSRNIAPMGWHVPNDAEWKTLMAFLGENTGGKLKETEASLWNSPNEGATNESGFSALAAGVRFGYDGTFGACGILADFWSCTPLGNSDYAWDFRMHYSNGGVHSANINKKYGFSIRCIKD